MEQYKELINQIMELKFPSPGGKEVKGVDLVMIAADTIGLSDQYIHKKGNLPQEKINILNACKNDLEVIIRHLEGSEKYYFALHKELAEKILNDYAERQRINKGNS